MSVFFLCLLLVFSLASLPFMYIIGCGPVVLLASPVFLAVLVGFFMLCVLGFLFMAFLFTVAILFFQVNPRPLPFFIGTTARVILE